MGCLFGCLAMIGSGLLALAGGGLGLWLLNPLWTWYWREREYEADRFAARCGQGPALVEYLEQHQVFDVATPYFMGTHPYTELRIDRLLHPEDYEREAREVSIRGEIDRSAIPVAQGLVGTSTADPNKRTIHSADYKAPGPLLDAVYSSIAWVIAYTGHIAQDGDLRQRVGGVALVVVLLLLCCGLWSVVF
ncbi:MAG: M48 family metalloprotease [Chloroflexota bacterium]|nr:M48 family metalloprotease [Chloroflexota bacterium]